MLLFDGALLISTRMYTGWRTLWPGLAKNIVVMLGGPASTIAIAAIGAALAWAAAFIPLAAALDCAGGNECIALVPAMTASAAAIAFHVAGALYFRIPFWYGFLFPLGLYGRRADGDRQRPAPLARPRELERPHLPMNARPQPDKSGSDHEHVDRISTTTTIVVIAVIAVVLHAIQLIILPFVIAGLVAYLTTPALDWLNVRTRLPRAPFAVLAFLIFLGLRLGRRHVRCSAPRPRIRAAGDRPQGYCRNLGGGGDPGRQHRFVRTIDECRPDRGQKVVEAVRDILEQPDKLAVVGGVAFLGIFGFSSFWCCCLSAAADGEQILGAAGAAPGQRLVRGWCRSIRFEAFLSGRNCLS